MTKQDQNPLLSCGNLKCQSLGWIHRWKDRNEVKDDNLNVWLNTIHKSVLL